MGGFYRLSQPLFVALLLRFFRFLNSYVSTANQWNRHCTPTNTFFMEKVSYWFDEPDFGDIVICDFPHRTETFVKRVIGIEGDVLRITDGVLYINDVPNYDYFITRL